MDPTDPTPTCPTCDGTGEVWHDAYDPRRGHYTVETPCPDCAEQAVAACDDEDAYEREEVAA